MSQQRIPPSFQRPSGAFVGAAWAALIIGLGAYLIGLWNAGMALNEKGYYLTLLLYGSFAAVSLQKTLRERAQCRRLSVMYEGLCWASLGNAALLLAIALCNTSLMMSEKCLFAMAFVLGLSAITAVKNNVRDFAGAEAMDVRAVDPA